MDRDARSARGLDGRARLAAAGLVLAVAATPALAQDPDAPDSRVVAFRADTSIHAGERVAVSGRVTPAGPTSVRLQRREGDGAWTPWATLKADARGRFAGAIPLKRSASVRALVLGHGDQSAGARRAVTVRSSVTMRWSVDPTEAIAGRPIPVEAIARPARPGERVLIEARRGGGRWRVLARPAVRVGGKARAAVKLPSGGTWRIRARVPAGRGNGEGIGQSPPLKVYGSNPHSIPSSASHYIVQAINEFKLYYYEDGRLRRVLPVVFGAPGTPTPSGRFRVYSKGAGPSAAFGPLVLWYHRGYGIHGTNQEYLLERSWRYYSHGCTRNFNDNIRWLWPRVPVGTPVLNVRS